ncbi:putative Major facilitator superfamily (MFS) profile domain-containing protein [Seiridium unicorne]|uniref:Major facilitator superfamily (MFS) profile domain-containing protein n=1 Tax=Seiridium unicorne TaxID=138068 RepID=A0ABR2VEJ2_9PEZI
MTIAEMNQETVTDDNSLRISVGEDAASNAEDENVPFKWSWNVVGSLLAFTFGYTACSWSFTMPANLLTVISAELDAGADYIWIVITPLLCQTLMTCIIGRLSDIFGRRWYFLIFNSICFVGLILSARSTSISMLIGANVLTGVGSAAQLAGSVLSGELVPNKHRYIVMAVISSLFGPITAISPAIGRLLAAHTSSGWRAIYYLNSGLVGGTVLLQFICYHPRDDFPPNRPSRFTLLSRLDYGGFVLFAGSTIGILMAISWGGSYYQSRIRSTSILPLMPLSIWNVNYSCLTMTSCVSVMTYYSLNVLWPQQLSTQYGQDSDQVGWMSCSINSGLVAGQLIGGLIASRIRHIKWQLLASCVLLTLFLGLMAAFNLPLAASISFSTIASIGAGYSEVITLTGSPMMTDPSDMGVSVGIQSSMRGLLTSASLAIYTTIYQNEIKKHMVEKVTPVASQGHLSQTAVSSLLQSLISGNISAAEAIPNADTDLARDISNAARIAYNTSFQTVYLTSLAFGICAVGAALAISGPIMDSKLTSRVAKVISKSTPVDSDTQEEKASV